MSRNSAYAFELERADSSKDWFIKRVGSNLAEADATLKRRGVLNFVESQLYVGPHRLPDWVRESTFVLKSVDAVPARADEIQIAFEVCASKWRYFLGFLGLRAELFVWLLSGSGPPLPIMSR